MKKFLIIFLLFSSVFIPAFADETLSEKTDSLTATQRGIFVGQSITPVDVDPGKPREPVLHHYDKHGNPLAEPVRFFLETDTVANVNPRSPYPLFSGVSIGVNFADAILMLTGQKYAGFDVHAGVSLHNWFFPVVEAGAGFARSAPEGGNYRYHGKLSPYFKIGLNYNFLYKSNPDYQAYLGVRVGFTPFSYDITDIKMTSGYWDEECRGELLNQKKFAIYGEAVAGLQVKIWKAFSMGWALKYHFRMHTSGGNKEGAGAGSDPWYIPGYGTNSPIGLSVSLIW
ncbi:MAG: hypothetical protein K2N03_00230, partial [Muribaculaceae bacterium]|nr:hypothetical protein [Muribaculaceae bacterium]